MFEQPLKIVVVEDDPLMQMSFRALIKTHETTYFENLNQFLAADFSNRTVDLILLDLCNSTDPNGSITVSRIPEVHARFNDSELVIQSGVSEVGIMRACVKNGASRFILKDHVADELPSLLERQLEFRKQREELDSILKGHSDVMKRLKRELFALRFEAHVDVLVEGETGSGKELCAKALHVEGPFVAVNVSAIPSELFESEFFGSEKGAFTGASQARAGYFESAANGVLFLDEIQSLAPAHQSKLLRVLETRRFTRVGSSVEKPLRARIVSASNINLRESVAKGKFREDLFFRLAPIGLQIPPLRVRGDDIQLLAQNFLREFDTTDKKRFTPAGLDYLKTQYDWPGNVRELRGLVRSLVIKSPIPLLDAPEIQEALGREGLASTPHLSQVGSQSGGGFAIDWNQGLDANVERLEKHLLEEILRQAPKSTEARDRLGLARSRFYEKVKQYGLLK